MKAKSCYNLAVEVEERGLVGESLRSSASMIGIKRRRQPTVPHELVCCLANIHGSLGK